MKGSASSPSEKMKGEKTEDTDEKPVTPPMRECEFCGKKFSSGKALGGHKRFHLQLLRKERESANKLAATSDNNGGRDEDNRGNRGSNIKLLSSLESPNKKLLCCLCNKEFPSEKSLFGHMRTHPGREWKGIHPPNDDDNGLMEVSPIPSSSSSSIDVSKSLPPSWSKTGIRGRKGIFDAILEGVVAIMVEKSHNKSSFNLQNRAKIEHDYGDREKEEEGNLVKEGRSLKKRKMKDEIPTSEKNTKLILRLKTCPQYEEDNVVDDGSLVEREFQCNICDKYFATFQSLRGHRSSHSKEKKRKSHKDDGDGDDDDEQRRYSENIREESSEPSSKVLREFDLNELPENGNIEDGGS